MNINDLRQLFIDQAEKYHTKSRMTKYDSLKQTADYFFYYSEGQGVKLGRKAEFRERFYDFLLNGNDGALSNIELVTACRYFLHPLRDKHYSKDVFSEYSTALEEFRAYVKKLETKTAELRKLRGSCFPFQILDEITDYIKYAHIRETDQFLLYAEIYNIGRVADIRQERARRKQKAIPTEEEATA